MLHFGWWGALGDGTHQRWKRSCRLPSSTLGGDVKREDSEPVHQPDEKAARSVGVPEAPFGRFGERGRFDEKVALLLHQARRLFGK